MYSYLTTIFYIYTAVARGLCWSNSTVDVVLAQTLSAKNLDASASTIDATPPNPFPPLQRSSAAATKRLRDRQAKKHLETLSRIQPEELPNIYVSVSRRIGCEFSLELSGTLSGLAKIELILKIIL